MAVIKNIRKLFISPITEEEAGVPTYGPMKYIPGLREITVSPNVEQGDFYAEGGLFETESAFSKVDVTFNIADISPADYMMLTGATAGADGGFIDNANDEAPYVALHYEKVLSGGVVEYATLFKGKLTKPEDSASTAEGSPNYQPKTLNGTFMALANGDWRYVIRDNDTLFVDTVETPFNWGDAKTFTLPTKA